MDSRLSEAERNTFYRFMRTELGDKHDCIVAATAIESVYQILKPPKPKDKGDE